AKDIFILLLSAASVASKWVADEVAAALSRELNDRGIRVAPVLIADCDVPPLLANRVYFDLRSDFEAGVHRFVDYVSALAAIQFSDFSAEEFERLVSDLLVESGFTVRYFGAARDAGFDFRATYKSRDPFGAEKIETWLVGAKFYRKE